MKNNFLSCIKIFFLFFSCDWRSLVVICMLDLHSQWHYILNKVHGYTCWLYNEQYVIFSIVRNTVYAVGFQTRERYSTVSRYFANMMRWENTTWKLYVVFAASLELFVLKWSFGNEEYSFKSWNFPNVRYYCPVDGLRVLKIQPRHCILHCLQMQECVALNYNKADGLCTLQPAPCTLALRMDGMQYMISNNRNHDQCLKWVPFTGSNPSSDRVVTSTHGYLACRLQINSGIFIGHYSERWQRCWVINGNIQHDSRSNPSEILTIASECTVGWVSYTSGTPLPPNAMMAWHSFAGDSLYVMMLTLLDPLPILMGYYNVGSSRGYATFHTTAHTFIMMDLMILL